MTFPLTLPALNAKSMQHWQRVKLSQIIFIGIDNEMGISSSCHPRKKNCPFMAPCFEYEIGSQWIAFCMCLQGPMSLLPIFITWPKVQGWGFRFRFLRHSKWEPDLNELTYIHRAQREPYYYIMVVMMIMFKPKIYEDNLYLAPTFIPQKQGVQQILHYFQWVIPKIFGLPCIVISHLVWGYSRIEQCDSSHYHIRNDAQSFTALEKEKPIIINEVGDVGWCEGLMRGSWYRVLSLSFLRGSQRAQTSDNDTYDHILPMSRP